MLPQDRGGACFCTRGAMQRYDFVLFILALAKTVTPGAGPPPVAGAACAAGYEAVPLAGNSRGTEGNDL